MRRIVEWGYSSLTASTRTLRVPDSGHPNERVALGYIGDNFPEGKYEISDRPMPDAHVIFIFDIPKGSRGRIGASRGHHPDCELVCYDAWVKLFLFPYPDRIWVRKVETDVPS